MRIRGGSQISTKDSERERERDAHYSFHTRDYVTLDLKESRTMRDAIATRFERCAHNTSIEGSAWPKTPRGKGTGSKERWASILFTLGAPS